MPKVVNEAERQREIALAVWKIVEADGLHQATVRRVAEEACLSVGSLRRSFPTQASLHEYAMSLMIDRIEQRLSMEGDDLPDAPLDQVIAALSNFLPLNEDQEAEMRVWLAFSTEAQHDKALKPLNDSMFDRTHEYLVRLLGYLADQGLISENIDFDREAGYLQAFIDGLTFHCLIRPEVATELWAHEALKRYFQRAFADGNIEVS